MVMGPGPTGVPNLVDATGTLNGETGDPYVLAGYGVTLQAPIVASWTGGPNGPMILYRTKGPWKLPSARPTLYVRLRNGYGDAANWIGVLPPTTKIERPLYPAGPTR